MIIYCKFTLIPVLLGFNIRYKIYSNNTTVDTVLDFFVSITTVYIIYIICQ